MIKIDNSLPIPIYKQIANSIRELIYDGEIKAGNFLPSERVLAEELNVARGTVKRAYEELSKYNLVSANVGKGTQVRTTKTEFENELLRMDELLVFLIEKGYSHKEIGAMINGRLKLKSSKKFVNIAAVDCNWEAIKIFNRQIKKFPVDLEITNFLLKDVMSYKSAVKTFSGYDIVITTSNHYDEVSPVLNGCQDKLLKIALAPDRETVIDMTLLKNEVGDNYSRIGVISKTERFRGIVRSNLESFSIYIDDKSCLYEKDGSKEVDKFLEGKTAIVMPPLYTMSLSNHVIKSLYKFKEKGGKIIIFNYKIEKGSLLHIEEKLNEIVSGRMNNG